MASSIIFGVMPPTYTPLRTRTLHLLWLMILCFCMSNVKAQSLWNKTYVEDRPKLFFSSILNIDSGYYVLGNSVTNQTPFFETGVVAKIDENGALVKYVMNNDSLTQRTGFFWNTLKQTSNHKLVFSGNGADTGQHLTFGFIDLGLNTMELFRYKSQNIFSYQGLALVEYPSKKFFVAGVHNVQSSFNANVLLVKIDSAGNKLWEKYYNQKASDYAASMIVLNNGNLMLGAERNDLSQTNVHSNTWLLEVDTGGNLVRQWFDPNDSTYVAEGLRQTQDGGFIYGAQKKKQQSVNDVYKSATIVKLDSNFNKQWIYDSELLCPEGFKDLEILPDGGYIACGSKNYRYAWIVKLDESGNVVWNREYVGIPDLGSKNYLTDIDVLSDGSLIAVGQCQLGGATPPQVGWFLKLDSNGCEIENCLVGIEEQSSKNKNETELRLWPNPTNGLVQIEISPDMLGATLTLYDLAGKASLQTTAHSENTSLDISSLPQGIYLLVAEHQGRFARAKLVVE